MKAVVIADTHMRKREQKLPSRLIEELQTADVIIHAGDWQSTFVYAELKKYGEVTGVFGNVDGEEMKSLLPEKRIMEVNGWKIGIVHGHGNKKTTEQRAVEAFTEPLDIIIFGHSHLPLLRYKGKTMLFNPGSPTAKRKLPHYSFGILHLGEEMQARHVFFQK
ncbi:metallophosphoesterase family protein [Bacillus piscicola]|uniref:metallophosphoesterase family protein n=1 Tax=Bacillus piscicola TaxID=1632684 RepID=UPI001F09A214|nr:metallophosphoesterase family protein [Bacillus piscicola]